MYRKRHKEQHRLVTDGSFVEAIARIVAKLPCDVQICFTNISHESSLSQFVEANHSLENDSEMLKYLARPWPWWKIEEDTIVAGSSTLIEPVRILTDLPIAIYRQGGSVSSIQIHCFPRYDSCKLLEFEQDAAVQTTIDEFVLAMSRLTSFFLGGGCMDFQRKGLTYCSGWQIACVRDYLNACLSGNNLRHITVDLFYLGYVSDEVQRSFDDYFSLDGILTGVDGSKLQTLALSNASLSEADHVSLVERVGNHWRSYKLYGIPLSSGIWAASAKLLHERKHDDSSRSRCFIAKSLTGGEFGDCENDL